MYVEKWAWVYRFFSSRSLRSRSRSFFEIFKNIAYLYFDESTYYN